MTETSLSTLLPLIALTQGDPAGIGPELCLKAIAREDVLGVCRPLLIGDISVLRQVAGCLGLPLPSRILTREDVFQGGSQKNHPSPAILDCACLDPQAEVIPGQPTRENGAASYQYIVTGIQGALQGLFGAVATAPITKTTLHMAGIHEPGHTEIFAKMSGIENFAMMYYSPRMVVSFVTCHLSLRSVPDALTVEGIRRVTALTGQALRKIRGREPRLAILGLNPHAGEGGIFGDEEMRIITPAVELCRRDGWLVEGPIPPDAAFMPHNLERFDGHVTLYHDQGSIPFKMVAMHEGVNVTLGLPIVRTSVDHGTAYDIAWQGVASESSLVCAIKLAASLAGK